MQHGERRFAHAPFLGASHDLCHQLEKGELLRFGLLRLHPAHVLADQFDDAFPQGAEWNDDIHQLRLLGRRRREQPVGLDFPELFAIQFTPGADLIDQRVVHRDQHFLVMRPQLLAHLGQRERLDGPLEIARAHETRLRPEQIHRVAKMQRHDGQRRQVQRAKVGHENGLARTGNGVMDRVGALKQGKRPLASVAQLVDVARQF